ncbi:MAG: hypothetical protein JXO51_04025 [Candidatus Aminicenantes bacterium]|nr:hypothetical protein [Candidatus Aminicenantes bacterium]
MKRITVILALLLAGAWVLGGADLPKVKPVQPVKPKPKPLYRFKIQGIKRIVTTPCRVVFQVQYYISPTYPKACFIGVNVPDRAHASSAFGYKPAGRRPDGVPKGQKHFVDDITVELKYSGSGAFTSSTMEVKIYDIDGALKGSEIIRWGQTWARFDIQGIKRVTTRPEYVKFQVQYFIDPGFAPACYIGAYIPDRAHQNASFSYKPAGRVPAGVPKGQKHFADNIWFDAAYSAAVPFTSSTIEVVIYTSSGIVHSEVIRWGQTWSTAVY